MSGLVLGILSSLIASVLFAVAVLLLFDVQKLKDKLFTWFGIKPSRTLYRLTSRGQVIKEFNELFVNYEVKNGGRICLMSNSGGYPEYDPYRRIVELAGNPTIEVYLAVSTNAMVTYMKDKPEIAKRLVEAENIRLFVFSSLVPYKFRIGVNTELERGFVCAYYGHRDNKVDLEGVRSEHAYFVEAFEAMFMYLLNAGTEITSDEQLGGAARAAEAR